MVALYGFAVFFAPIPDEKTGGFFTMRVCNKHRFSVLLLTALLLVLAVPSALAEEGQVSGLVWLEKTVDGVIGGNESGVSGAKVTLERRNENGDPQVAVNTTTDKSGNFYFSSLPAGDYRLRIEVSSEYHFTEFGQGSAALPAQGNVSYSPYFTVQDGQSLIKDIGLTKSYASVSVIAFEDENANGGRMQSEELIRNVQVEVIYEYEGEAYSIAAAITNRQGEALLQHLSPGTYRVRVTLPENFVVGPLGQKINGFYNCILPNEDNTGLSEPFTLNAKEGVTMGIGMVRTGSLTGKAWYDANYNGKWDSDESGLTDAVITLYSPSLNLTRTAQADASGVYSFRGLQPGDYRLEFALPEGMIFTYPGASLITETASRSGVNVLIQVDVTTSLGPVGAMPAAGLSFTLYEDVNLNGMRDEDEPLIPSASIQASQGGRTVEKAVTDESGTAALSSLRGGETALAVSLPEGYIFTYDQENLFSISGAQTEAQASVTLDGTEPDARFAAAVTRPAAISGMLFEDLDNSGVYQDGSALLSGYTVQAVDQDGAVCAAAVTDENGAYSLSPLVPGAYTVRFLLDDAYVASPFVEGQNPGVNHIQTQTPEYGETEALSLAPGQQIADMDGGVFRAGLVDGYVLVDAAYAETENDGLSGVTVQLLDQNGDVYSAYTYGSTDENGYFFIKGVLPGSYTLSYILPDNGAFTSPDTTRKQITSEAFVIESGSQIRMPELRGIYTSTLAGVIQHDSTLENFSALLTLVGHNVPQAYEIHTQPNGSYSFSGLRPDLYTLTVTLPEGLVFGQLPGSPIQPTASNQASADLSFSMGKSLMRANILASLPVSLTGTVYYDDDLSGNMGEEEYGAEERGLSLWMNGEEAAAATTDENGVYSFANLVPAEYELRIPLDENEELVDVEGAQRQGDEWRLPLSALENASQDLPIMRYASICGAVWSLDGTLNGVAGVPVSLLDADGAVLSTVASDASGSYAFGTLMPGDYTLSAVLPQGHLFARAEDTRDRESFVQSQPDGTPVSIPFSVPMGDDLSGIDIGIGAIGQIGDRAWLDENGNGMQDIGEPDMPGIVIELYQYGELIASATTDEYGRYLLSDLHPGEYEMHVTMHAELKATAHQSEFPLVASIMPESKDLTVIVPGVIVPSGDSNLHCDLGFQLRKKGVYPSAMDLIPQKDWRPYSER